MKKHVFVKDGKVVSVSVVMDGSVSCSIEGAELHYSDADFAEGMAVEVVDGILTKVSDPAPEPAKVSPVEFKLLFTPQERVAIKVARQSDPVIDDFYDIVEDPRLTHVDLGLSSTQAALDYLTAMGLLADGRKAEIISGSVK